MPLSLPWQVKWVLDKTPGLGSPQAEIASPDGSSQAEFTRLRSHFDGSVVGIRNVMLQSWFANALARPRTTAGAAAELRAIKAAYDDLSGRPAPRVFAAFNRHARQVMACGSWVAMLSGLRLGLRAGGQQPPPRRQFVAILSQAVLDSYDAGYHRYPNPYSGAPQELKQKHAARIRAEAAARASTFIVPDSKAVVAAPVAGAQLAAEGSPSTLEGEGGMWMQAAARKPMSAGPRSRVAAKLDSLNSNRRVTRELCFMSWESRPVGVISDTWI